MRLSEAWLREYVDPPIGSDELIQQLTMAGLEVDSATPAAEPFSGVVVGEVLAVEGHPQAERLKVCRVGVGAPEPLQIVCGAPNVAVGVRVPTALEGACLPGGLTIRRTELRGIASYGMMCSARELGFEEGQPGLLVLPETAQPGVDVRACLGLDDRILEIDLTPNRADCLSVEGIAREVALLNELDCHSLPLVPAQVSLDERLSVQITDTAACPRYLGRLIRGVRADAETPFWMREKLRRAGLRSLGPLVDVTNYVLLELGQPLHAFDADRLRGAIRVRWARSGESLTLLNEQVVKPDEDTLLIADDDGPLALAGVMGGRESAVTGETRNVFLECAFFFPSAIMGRARRYGLSTDSSHRFERGVDPDLQLRAIERATTLILDLAGGAAGPVVEVGEAGRLPLRDPIVLRAGRVEKLLGLSIDPETITRILRRLGMRVEPHPDGWSVVPPSFRFDLHLEVDLIEEIGRVYGYDRLPRRRPMMSTAMQPASERTLDADRIRDMLVDRGYQEAITYSFVEPSLQAVLEPGAEALALKNPISSDLAVMRTTLWCGLLDMALRNQHRQQSRVRLFEVGGRFRQQDGALRQERSVAGLVMGLALEEQWGVPGEGVDFFDLKADLEAILHLTGRNDRCVVRHAEHPALHPGQSAEIRLDGEHLGWLGMLHPKLERQFGFDQRVFLFEVDLDRLLPRRLPMFRALSKYPQVRRDLAVTVAESVSAEQVVAAAKGSEDDIIRQVILFDVYRGKGVESGGKSVALGLILQDDHETLTDARIDAVVEGAIRRLSTQLHAKLRT